jgi:uncharacterized protein GlcG (DUF336 family)
MNKKLSIALLLAVSSVAAAPAFAAVSSANADRSGVTCSSLPTSAQLQTALAASTNVLQGGTSTSDNGGFHFPMWATLVDSSGRVCAVAKLASTDPWPASRVISAQKANTANSLSLNRYALSTANLYTAVQPGGSLYGLQHSNPVNTIVAYRGASTAFGTSSDPMVGLRVGGVNVFGGGLALYNASQQVIGAIGVSGDTSCADHNVAEQLRYNLALATAGTGSGVVVNKTPNSDNIIFDITLSAGAQPTSFGGGVSTSGFGHPTCVNTTAITTQLPASF